MRTDMKIKTGVLLRCGLLIAAAIFAVMMYLRYTGLRGNADRPERGTWRVTQYAGKSGNQSMFYLIENADGELVLIDGGWDNENDVNSVMEIIERHDSHVTAWIITHAHPDHVGSFNAIMRDESKAVTVDRIYTPKVNRERYEETARDYDVIDSYYEFLSLTESLPQVTYLERGDEVELLGLEMRVLHSWDSYVDAQEKNLMNNGSLMFRLRGAEDVILFCSDVQKEMEAYIEESGAEHLGADYVQCGHHGNWGLTTDFYALVDAEEAFIDAPEWITGDTTGTYDAPELISWFNERGTVLHLWDSPQNAVVIR